MLKNAKEIIFLCLLGLLKSPLAQGDYYTGDYKVSLDHITIAVSKLEETAKLFSQKGFTLKKPHHYRSGAQAGLTTQAIRLESGQYIQLVSVSKSSGSSLGPLAKWYQSQLRISQGGVTVVLNHSHPKRLCEDLMKKQIPCEFKKLSRHHWMSFKTESSFHPLAFIHYTNAPSISEELTTHSNSITSIKKVKLNQQGDAFKWAAIMTLARAQGIGLEFSTTSYKGGAGFINEVVLHGPRTKETGLRPHFREFSIGHTVFRSNSQ